MHDDRGAGSYPVPVAGASALTEQLTNRPYTIPEIIRLTSLNRKQVDYWNQTGLLAPIFRDPSAKIGSPASFSSAREVIKALIMCDLRRRGFTPSQIQQVAHNLLEHDIQVYESEAYLLTDGYSVYYAFTDGEVIDVLKHRRQMLLVPIHEQVAKLKEVA
ncbi:hypothetical protein BH11ARM1_BH11ARM1_10440 [soil metagenome]